MSDSTGLAVGETAPDFDAPLVRPDGSVESVPLSSLVAEKPVLLSFYTIDFSPDCIEEWCSFRDFDWFASGDRVHVVGASKSRVWLHRKFIDWLGLGFPLYADRDLDAAEKFGVKYRWFGLFPRSKRSCFLVDEEMTIRYKWVGEHWFDATRDTPPMDEVRDSIDEVLGEPDVETFGFGSAGLDEPDVVAEAGGGEADAVAEADGREAAETPDAGKR